MAVRDDGKETVWQSKMISSMNADRKLSNDYLRKIVNVLNGFDIHQTESDAPQEISGYMLSR